MNRFSQLICDDHHKKRHSYFVRLEKQFSVGSPSPTPHALFCAALLEAHLPDFARLALTRCLVKARGGSGDEALLCGAKALVLGGNWPCTRSLVPEPNHEQASPFLLLASSIVRTCDNEKEHEIIRYVRTWHAQRPESHVTDTGRDLEACAVLWHLNLQDQFMDGVSSLLNPTARRFEIRSRLSDPGVENDKEEERLVALLAVSLALSCVRSLNLKFLNVLLKLNDRIASARKPGTYSLATAGCIAIEGQILAELYSN